MLDAGLVSNAMLNRIDRSADSAANLARAKVAYGQNKDSDAISAKADKAAQDFESLFISQMIEQMFGESLGDDFFGSDESSDVYKQLMVDQYGKQISASGGIGIADYVKRELLKMQEI